ncbi:hypothetical protein HanPI659440_Chr03g0095291 [Helianthus annuus]|nr:hypothetical protein HanPI659440_Chr03g0095291 [Helianthus annuus]
MRSRFLQNHRHESVIGLNREMLKIESYIIWLIHSQTCLTSVFLYFHSKSTS